MRLRLICEFRDYINPDHFYKRGAETVFIYTDDGNIYHDNGRSHNELITSNDELYYRYEFDGGSIQATDLFGRVNQDRTIASFWNSKEKVYKKSLRPCIDKLISNNMLSPDGAISTPIHGTFYIKDFDDVMPRELTPEQKETLELQRQLHMMPAAQKKIAMQKLGLLPNNVTTKANRWQQAGQKAGVLTPGQKWWAPTSESRKHKLSSIEEGANNLRHRVMMAWRGEGKSQNGGIYGIMDEFGCGFEQARKYADLIGGGIYGEDDIVDKDLHRIRAPQKLLKLLRQ